MNGVILVMIMNFNPSDFKDEGLYLFFDEGVYLNLTKKNIQEATKTFWENNDKVLQKVRGAIEFRKCEFCPLEENSICEALKPILPFLSDVDNYVSYDKVISVYKHDKSSLLSVTYTSLHEVFKYLSIMSLVQYCKIGRPYWKYYYGIVPTYDSMEIAKSLYLNMFWINGIYIDSLNYSISELNKMNSIIVEEFTNKITITSTNQVKRLNLICKNDVFINAYVNAQSVVALLGLNIKKILKESIVDLVDVSL